MGVVGALESVEDVRLGTARLETGSSTLDQEGLLPAGLYPQNQTGTVSFWVTQLPLVNHSKKIFVEFFRFNEIVTSGRVKPA